MTLPDTMRAMVTMGHGDLDRIVLHEDWPRPDPPPGEVLIRVKACGLNNTDVNTRIGWYASEVTGATAGETTGSGAGTAAAPRTGGLLTVGAFSGAGFDSGSDSATRVKYSLELCLPSHPPMTTNRLTAPLSTDFTISSGSWGPSSM